MYLTEGVFTVPLEYDRGGETTTIHPTAVETRPGLLLVDVGLPGSVDQIRDILADVGHGLSDVAGVLLTHHDGDHAGGLSDLDDAVDGLTVYAHEREAPYVDGRNDPVKGDGDRYPPATVDVELTGGEVFHTTAGPMTVVETPGHSPGHVSLYLPDVELLIAGDALVAEDRIAGPNPEFTPKMDRAIDSVGRLADLDVETVHCHHGGTVDVAPDELRDLYASLGE